MIRRTSHPRIPASLALVSALVFGASAAAQAGPPGDEPAVHDEPALVLAVELEGRVLEPDGTAAEGAVVVSSAGGRAVTDDAGRYRLALAVPLEAEAVLVTATGATGRSSQASRTVAVLASGRIGVGALHLTHATTCAPGWTPTFGGLPGTDGVVDAQTVHDDGDGPALYAGGAFSTAGTTEASSVARWDGSRWSPLGSGMPFAAVHALAVYDDGGGAALYAGGTFSSAGGVPAWHVARWDGASWAPLGTGTDNTVFALAVYDDGSGPALFVGGRFTIAGGVAASGIAKWDGASWTALAGGVNGHVSALTVYDDGDGAALYAGGTFTSAGGASAQRIARWDGASWSPLGSGLGGIIANVQVHALAVYDDGTGPVLVAGGAFHTAGGGAASRIAKWDGARWTALGSGMTAAVRALAVHDAGEGPELFAGGAFTSAGGVPANRMAKWDGARWMPVGSGMNDEVHALAVFAGDGAPELHAGGPFTHADGAPVSFVAAWDGAGWRAFDRGVNGIVYALAVHDDGAGAALYAGGELTGAGGRDLARIGRWDGSRWSPLGSGVSGVNEFSEYVRSVAVHDDGGGAALCATGAFISAGGVAASGMARWDGSSWAAFGGGVQPGYVVLAMTEFDAGSGPELHAGGTFPALGGVPADGIARWDGSSWSALGGGLGFYVASLRVHDDGSGPALFAGGSFTSAGAVTVNGIAKWNGASWSPLGNGVTGGSFPVVEALAVYDDGSGPALYAGGTFLNAGGVVANRIAKWNGSSWARLGVGMNGPIRALAVYDDGSGPVLVAGGSFTTAGGVAANRIAKWDGASWTPFGSGTNGPIRALAVHDDGAGPALFAGGQFTIAHDSGDSHLARWGPDILPPLLACEPVFATDAFQGPRVRW